LGNIVPNFSVEQAESIKRAVNEYINGVDNKGRVAVLQTPWDYLNFGLSSVDMELMGTLKMSLQQWCRVFGLPQVLFDTDTTSYNNYQNALRDMMTNTIIPLCSTLRDELNRWLLPIYGEDVYIDFDITSIPEMQQDMERMTRVLRDANWLTMDEKRVAMNYEPKYGAYEYSYVNQGLVVLDQVAMDLTYDDTNGSDTMDSSDDTISQDIEREELSSGARDDEQGS